MAAACGLALTVRLCACLTVRQIVSSHEYHLEGTSRTPQRLHIECWRTGGGYGTTGAEDDLALVEIGVRCSLEQVTHTPEYTVPFTCTGTHA